MRRERLRELLTALRDGEIERDELLDRLEGAPTERLPFAELDHHRTLRLGYPEAVYAPGKTVEQVVEICRAFADRAEGFLVTRASEEQLAAVEAEFPDAEVSAVGRIAHLPAREVPPVRVRGPVLILTGGTADLPVAEEARVAARAMGNPVELRADVGVSAVHRVLSLREEMRRAAAVIVAAGMDGALPSVVGGLVPTPVVAVPTSAGYGASLEGLAPLLTMLTSCAPGITVVNVDNGYGAACAATRINQHRAQGEE